MSEHVDPSENDKEEIKDMNDIFDLMITGCDLEQKEIEALTIANLLKVCGMVSEYIRLSNIDEKELGSKGLEELNNKKEYCEKLLDDELKLIDNFVATLAVGEYARNYNDKLLKLSKLEIMTNIMKDSNEALGKLKEYLDGKLNEKESN